MADLRAAFEDAGFDSVSTYIQSGNVLFESTASAASLESNLETDARATVQDPARRRGAVARASSASVVDNAPDGFGAQPETYHSDVIFLKKPLTSKQAMKVVAAARGRRPGLARHRRDLLRSV